MSSKDEQLRAMRWLYEDEQSYRKAAAKLKLEELKAHKEKHLIRQYRKRQRRIWLSKAESAIRPVISKLKKQATRKRLVYGLAVFGVLVFGAVLVGLLMFSHNPKDQTKTLGATTLQPDFNPVAPQDGSQKVTTTESNHQKIVTYQDTFAGSALIVSQQRLPDNFKTDSQAITKLDQFKAAEALDTPKGKLYITTNTTGQQWAAMTFNDVLIFFQTNKRLGFDEWYKYIKALDVK